MKSKLFPDVDEAPVQLDLSLAIVNIVLLLILFFLATGRLLNPEETDVAPPLTTELPFDDLPQPLLMVLDDGSFEINGTAVIAENLEAAIRQQVIEAPIAGDETGGQVLHILIDGSAPAHDLLRLLEAPVMAQLDIRLITLHEGERQ